MASLTTKQTAQTIIQQIQSGGKAMVWSWGACAWRHGTDELGNDFLQFSVRGFLHKGFVRVTYNAGADLYTLRVFVQKKGVTVNIKQLAGVYGEDLTTIIDSMVERDPSQTDAAYKARVSKYLQAVNL